MAAPSSPLSSSLSCEQCGETFHRREHRDRHLLRHTGARPFACAVCDKSFSRNDTLLRHRALHKRANTRSPRNADPAAVTVRRRVQACLQCARLKQRCEGGEPCARCVLRESVCSYAPSTMPVGQTERSSVSSQRSRLDVDESHDEPDADDAAATGSLDGPPPLQDIEPLTFAVPPGHDVMPNMTLNNNEISYDAMATDFNFSWTMPWAMEGLELPVDTPNLSMPWNNASSFTPRDQNYLNPQYICSRHVVPCSPFPEPEALSLEIAGAENYGHLSHVPEQSFEELHVFYRTQQLDPTRSPPIPRRVLHAFIELYFEHFDPQFPFLHPSRLEVDDVPWILLLATAAVGSHYSELAEAPGYHAVLFDLLNRAVESTLSVRMSRTDIVVIQAVFLLHVLWMFSGSHRDKIVQQHKRSILATLCRDLLGKRDKPRGSNQAEAVSEQQLEQDWGHWLAMEERIRVLSCVRVLESLAFLFLDTPPAYDLRDSSCRLPAQSDLWQSRNAHDWKCRYGNLPAYEAERTRPESSEAWSKIMLRSAAFTSKLMLLELFLDERNIARQLRSSQLLRSSFASYLGMPPRDSAVNQGSSTSSMDTLCDMNALENPLFDKSVDLLAFAAHEQSVAALNGHAETIIHVLAILRRTPLSILHRVTGWQTDEEQMLKSRTMLKNFFLQNPSESRKCFWHATCIFRSTRSTQRLACHDVFSLTVSMCYIYCYSELRLNSHEGTNPRADALRSLYPHSRRTIVRLDQLRDRSAIERWIASRDEGEVIHLTGVGLLDGPDRSGRFLRDVEKTLRGQIAWRGFCCAFADSFAQLRRGENPSNAELNEYQDAA